MLSSSGLPVSLKELEEVLVCGCVSENFIVIWQKLLCVRKSPHVLKKIVEFSKSLLCSQKDCGVLKKIVVFSKRLLCSSKDCCVSEQKLSCVVY